MTWKEAVDNGFIQALLDGKTAQVKEIYKLDELGKNLWSDIDIAYVLNFIAHKTIDEIRIKPEKKRVPLAAEDLPLIFWVQDKTCIDWLLATEIGSYGIKIGLKFYSWEYLKDKEHIWSNDRKTKNNFWKEVEG